jgi:hypothetical protein
MKVFLKPNGNSAGDAHIQLWFEVGVIYKKKTFFVNRNVWGASVHKCWVISEKIQS